MRVSLARPLLQLRLKWTGRKCQEAAHRQMGRASEGGSWLLDVPDAGQAASLQDWFSPVGTAAGPGASDQPGPPERLG